MTAGGAQRRIPAGQRMRGVSLVELMVALTIGLVLVGGALTVFIDSRATYRVNQTVSRVQENGLYALGELARSLQLAGYWGENNSALDVVGRSKRSGGAISQASPLPAATNNCAAEWYTDLERPVFGLDASSDPAAPAAAKDANDPYLACIPDSKYVDGTDILVVRHVEPAPVASAALLADTAYIRADPNQAELFIGATEPGGFAASAQNYRLVATAYYVSSFSETPGDGIPALKRAALTTGGGGIPLVYVPAGGQPEDIVIPGVENLQVQFGVDTTGDGSANQYRNANQVGATQWDNVVSVRLWMVVRAENTEQGYQNTTSYALPQGNFLPGAGDSFRRLLLTRTVQLRN